MKLYSRSILAACAALLTGSLVSAQSVTVTFDAKALFNSSGSILPDNTLFLLVADTGNNGFGVANAGSLSVGSFLNGDDQILGRGFTEISGGAAAGTGSTASITLGTGTFSQLTTGDSLAVLWFPGLDTNSFSLLSGASYGLFTTSSPASGSSWQIPVSGTINIEAFNLVNDTGSLSGRALLTAIPEPSTYAAIVGAASLALAVSRRSRQRRTATFAPSR